VAVGSLQPRPTLPDPARWPALPAPPSVALPAEPPVWTRSAQVATAVLLTAALGLLGWHVWAAQRRACRPTELAAGESRLDLNRADRAALLQLPGVGEGLAQRIEEYHRENGPFRRVEDLRRVKGVGPRLLERLRPLVEVAEEDSPDASADALPATVPVKETPAVRGGGKDVAGGPVEINVATAEQLQHLPGIGPKMAQRILEARAQRPFRSVEDLRRVPGIGAKTLERLRPHVTVSSPR
jgi:competence protein ComEA